MQVDEISIEVAFAKPSEQLIIPLKVSAGATAQQAIETSGILAMFPEIDLNINKIGIFGKLIKLDTPLKHLDRIEIYRPLIVDAKEARKQRAAKSKLKR